MLSYAAIKVFSNIPSTTYTVKKLCILILNMAIYFPLLGNFNA